MAHEPITSTLMWQALKTGRRRLALAQTDTADCSASWDCSCERSLFVGVAYIVLFEGILASLDTVARRLTIMFYFRVLVSALAGAG